LAAPALADEPAKSAGDAPKNANSFRLFTIPSLRRVLGTSTRKMGPQVDG
jgi:hypothetical protein